MVARNAFGELATEETLRRLLGQTAFAKTINDVLRVVVDNGPQAIVYRANSSDRTVNRDPFGDANAVYMVDEREVQRVQSEQQFMMLRTQRWSFS